MMITMSRQTPLIQCEKGGADVDLRHEFTDPGDDSEHSILGKSINGRF